MKNICFVNTNKFWGGGEKWHYENAQALSKETNKYKVFFICYPEGKLPELISKESVSTLKIKVKNFSFFNLIKLINLTYYLKKNNIETLIINQPNDLKILGLAGRIAGIKNIIYRRGSAIPIKNRISNIFIFKFLVDFIIANSEETKKTINEKNKKMFPEEKIKVICNGIKIDEIKDELFRINLRKELELDNNKILIANIGRLTFQKGHNYLLKAIFEVKKMRKDFLVVLVGKGEEEEVLKKICKELDIEKQVKFLGFREDIYDIISQVDFLVHTALWEGFGYVIVESLACGKPVVSTDISNISEIIDKEDYGYLAQKEDVKDIAEKILKMMNNYKTFDKDTLLNKAKEYDFFKKKKELEELI